MSVNEDLQKDLAIGAETFPKGLGKNKNDYEHFILKNVHVWFLMA